MPVEKKMLISLRLNEVMSIEHTRTQGVVTRNKLREEKIHKLNQELESLEGFHTRTRKGIYTEYERDFIAKHYATSGPIILAEVLERDERSIIDFAYSRGLTSTSFQSRTGEFRWSTKEHDPLLIQAHQRGETMTAFAEKHGTHIATVSRHANRLELDFKTGRPKNDDEKQLSESERTT